MNAAALLRLAVALAFPALLVPASLHAAIPLPDHILYGTVSIGNRAITAAETTVLIEARRTPGTPPVATYRMGSRPRLGTHLYELRLQLEEAPASSHRAFEPGQSVHLTVRNASGIQFQTVHVISDIGVAQRLDFGLPVDSRGTGAPDTWQLAHLGGLPSGLDIDSDGDGVSDAHEYTAGTLPRNPDDAFRLALQRDGDDLLVTFLALAADGPGYQGRQRFYALESAPDPVAGPWTPIENHSRIPGRNQFLIHIQPAGTPGPLFYRARVWLEGP
ncbi:MAG: hypothetical protein KF833_09660 [Verrucomicrobiae bacterium]|nr:hypothetical protein [Verrucomicrobiae bacterium]